LGYFIRDFLAGSPAVAHDIYSAYKRAVRSEPDSEFIRIARQKVRRQLAREKRTRPHERVKVTGEEIDAALPEYLGKHPWKGRRACSSYNSFMHYIYMLRQLGLVEYTGQTSTAEGKAGSASSDWHEAHEAVTIKVVAGGLTDLAWQNINEAYRSRG
jgi:hypothetical protein